MSIGKADSVDLAVTRQAPSLAPPIPASMATSVQRETLGNPVLPSDITPDAIAAAVQSVNAYVESVSSSIQFSIDHDTGRTIVKMVDTATHEVLRQFPSEEMLSISRSIARMQGLLINRNA